MSSEWLKWSKGLTRKPEILQIAARLMMSPAAAAGTLMLAMEWLDDAVTEYDEFGNACVTLGALPVSFIDTVVGVSGFAESLAEVGWVRKTPQALVFVNAARHNGKTAKSRALTRDRVASLRAKRAEHNGNAPSVTTSILTSQSGSGGAGGGERPPGEPRPTLDEWLKEGRDQHPGWPAGDCRLAWEHYEKVGWKSSSGLPVKKWRMCIGTCFSRWADKHPAANRVRMPENLRAQPQLPL